MRFLVFLSIFILIFSIFPALSGEPNSNFEIEQKTEPMPNQFIIPTEQEIESWGTLVNFYSEPIFNLEEFNANNVANYGPELVERRTQNSNTYVDENNMVTVQMFAGEVNFRNSDDTWQQFNTDIKTFNQIPVGAKIAYDYASTENSIQTYFRSGYSQPAAVLTVVGDDSVAWEPAEIGYLDNNGNQRIISEPFNTIPVARNNKVLYPNTYPEISDVFTVTEHKLKHEIIIKSLPEIPDSSVAGEIQKLGTSGFITLSNDLKIYPDDEIYPITSKIITDGSLNLKTEDGTSSLMIPSPVAFELNDPAERITCKFVIEPVQNRFKITINTPYEWLSDPERNYPVVIDPTIVGTKVFQFKPGESNSNDTWIGDNTGLLVDKNFGKDDYLLVGGDNLQYRALARFDLATLPPKDVGAFASAIFKLSPHDRDEQPNYDSGMKELVVHEVQEAWIEGTGNNEKTDDGATWKTKDGSNSWSGGNGGTYLVNKEDISVATNVDDLEFDVYNLVTKWWNNPATNFGLMVKYNDSGASTNLYKAFYSSYYDNKAKRPRLEVTFQNDEPKRTTFIKQIWLEDQNEGTSFYMDTVFTDPNNDQLYITVWDGSAWVDELENDVFNLTLLGDGSIGNPWLASFDLKKNAHGTKVIIFNATDRIEYTEADIIIEVKSINDAPIMRYIGPQSANEEVYLYIPLKVIEVENQKVTWDLNVSSFSLPNYMDNIYIEPDTNDNSKARLIYLPSNTDVPTVYINISVQDALHTEINPSIDWEHVTITVNNVNDDPLFSRIKEEPVYENTIVINVVQNKKELIYFQAYDDDIINGDSLEFYSDAKTGDDGDNFTIVELTGADIPLNYRNIQNTEVAMVEWRPQNKHVGEYTIMVGVKDEQDAFHEVNLLFIVKNANDPPYIVSTYKSPPDDGKQYTNRDFINFSCVVDDLDLHIPDSMEKLNITWYSNISALMGYGNKVNSAQLKAGHHKIEILVKDISGDDVNGIARGYLYLPVEKSITLQQYCEQGYNDVPDFDDIEYSYNDKSKKFTVSQGRYEEVDAVNLSSYYDNGNLVIELVFGLDIELTSDFIIKIFLVTEDHLEPTPKYDKRYTSKFFEKELYQPLDNVTYGFFSKSDGTVIDDTFRVVYSLGELEAGNTRFEPLKPYFKIFATIKWYEIEYFRDYDVENFRYDSIGYGAAIAPPPPKGSGNDDSNELDMGLVRSGIGIVIVILIILVIAFVVMRKKKAKEEKTVIDFSKPTGQVPMPQQQTMDVQNMFMSPLEQQFKGGAMGQGQQQMLMQPRPPQQYPSSGGGAGAGMQQQQQPQQFKQPQLPPGPKPQQQPTVQQQPQQKTQPIPQPQPTSPSSPTPQPKLLQTAPVPTQAPKSPQPKPQSVPQPKLQSQQPKVSTPTQVSAPTQGPSPSPSPTVRKPGQLPQQK
jgi:hypothetical protein